MYYKILIIYGYFDPRFTYFGELVDIISTTNYSPTIELWSYCY